MQPMRGETTFRSRNYAIRMHGTGEAVGIPPWANVKIIGCGVN